jgi:prepilin-type N-terminal cleavage/methylation domain-containing protein
MKQERFKIRRGFTLTELSTTIIVATVLIIAAGTAFVGSEQQWRRIYGRANSDVVTGAIVAQKTFDNLVRKASSEEYQVDSSGTWIEVYSYASASSTEPDRYTRLYGTSGDLLVEEGTLDPKATLSVRTVCSNVTRCVFKANGRSAQMFLTLKNADQEIEVPAVAFMHNK